VNSWPKGFEAAQQPQHVDRPALGSARGHVVGLGQAFHQPGEQGQPLLLHLGETWRISGSAAARPLSLRTSGCSVAQKRQPSSKARRSAWRGRPARRRPRPAAGRPEVAAFLDRAGSFAGLSPREHGFQASFALHRWMESPWIVRKVDYGPRWRGHSVSVEARTDLDDELRGWLQEAHDVVGLQAGLADRAGRRPRASRGT
jgi:hypothetical protein